MARSTYIYIARNEHGELLGASTVKHELLCFLRAWPANARQHSWGKEWQVLRMRDGSSVLKYSHKVDDITDQLKEELKRNE